MIGTIPIWITDWQNTYADFQRKIPGYDKVYILGTVEAEPNKIGGSEERLRTLLSLCQVHKKDVTILTSAHPEESDYYNFPKLNIDIKVVYWPTYWLMFNYTRLNRPDALIINNENGLNVDDFNVGLNYDFEHTFISMNGIAKAHRCLMQDILCEYGLLNYGKYSWRHLKNTGHWYDFKFWNEERIFLDQEDDTQLFNQELIPKVYKNCFMQLVPETHEDRFFLTEKTSLPLFFNKPFLVAGSLGFHNKLKGLGFLLYDELFDYSFDAEKDIEKRYRMIADNIKQYSKLSKKDYIALYQKIFDKCRYNKKIAMNYALKTELFPKEWEELNNEKYTHLQHVNPYHCNSWLNQKRHVFEI